MNGFEILYKWINPIAPVVNTARAFVIDGVVSKYCLNIKIIIILRNTVKLAGILFLNIFNKKLLPSTNDLFGSSAKINDGIPMVVPVISVSWIGTKKYGDLKNKLVRINKNV